MGARSRRTTAGHSAAVGVLAVCTISALCAPVAWAEELAAGTERSFAGIAFVWCPAGDFQRGSALAPAELAQRWGGYPEWYSDESPRRGVTIARGFWISKHEVTKGDWARVMETKPWETPAFPVPVNESENSPATWVSWEAAQGFIKALNATEAGSFRLPTEDEWEYACRAATQTPFYFGEDVALLDEHAWYWRNTRALENEYVQDVGTKKPNSWGLHDMFGNAWEWCQDAYHGPKSGGDKDDPGVTRGEHRIIRGGCYNSTAALLRCASRLGSQAANGNEHVGFRICRDP